MYYCETTPMLDSKSPGDHKAATTDDKLWTLIEYVENRLKPALQQTMQRTKWLRLWYALRQGLVLVGLVGASGTAVLGQQWLMPIILPSVAGIAVESSSLTTQLGVQTEAVERLESILDGWESGRNDDLEMATDAGRRENLVEQVEDALVRAAG